MKERITYLLHVGEEGFDPSRLTVSKNSIAVPPIKAAKEHRVTFGFSELPQELWTVLKQCHELHVRWASPEPYTSTPPFVSRISPGFHAYFTPTKENKTDTLCPLLKEVFGDELKCETPSSSFVGTPILAERFSMSASFQYHHLLPSLQNLVTYIQRKICGSSDATCQDQASSLSSANYVDLDFDTISHALVINAFWAEGPSEGGYWSEEVGRGKADTMEVGILNNEVPLELEELSLAGFLTVVGEDTKPKPTLFSFPSRHHPLPSTKHPVSPTFHATFDQPTGLHPTLRLHFPSAAQKLTSPGPSCALHTYLTLPSTFFLDKYQFSSSDDLFLASHRLRHLRSLAGATDLEAPDWVVPQWGSAALFELAHPLSHPDSDSDSDSSAGPNPNAASSILPNDGDGAWEVSIPLHLRYLAPAHNASGLANASLPWPVVFWACPAEEGTKMSVNPFDRTNIGYEGLFGNRVMFYHVPPTPDVAGAGVGAGARLVETARVPVLDLDKARHIELWTVAAVVVASAWILYRTVCVIRAHGWGHPAEKQAAEAAKKE